MKTTMLSLLSMVGIGLMLVSCEVIESGVSGGSLEGTWDLVGLNYTTNKHPNCSFKEYWVFTGNTITYYDYENEHEIDRFGPYEYKREGDTLFIKKGENYCSYPTLTILSLSKTDLELEHHGLGFQGYWCIATYKKRTGDKDNTRWVN